MSCLLRKMVLRGAFIASAGLFINATPSFAQETSAAPVVSQMGNQGVPHHRRHHKKGFFLGMCVGQTLAAANPPVLIQPGQKPTKSDWQAIKAAKKSCFQAFVAAKGNNPGGNNGGSSPSPNPAN